eukprot:m.128327 g.128327  ORF g.128327 m.128327 type:complete len:469 (-) comp9748_c0_seq1:1895-3301(-)
MTLNTFHFAGRSESNVTLGIPRLREIIMTGSPNIKTPVMDVPIKPSKSLKKAQKLVGVLRRVSLADILQSATVTSSLGPLKNGERSRMYKVRLVFIPPALYSKEFATDRDSILSAVEQKLMKRLVDLSIKKSKNSLRKLVEELEGETDVPAQKQQEEKDSDADSESEGEEDAEDAGTLASKAKKNRDQVAVYEKDSDDEDTDDEGEGAEEAPTDTANTAAKESESDTDDHDAAAARARKQSQAKKERIREVLKAQAHYTDYDFDEHGHWCQFVLSFPCTQKRLLFVNMIEQIAPKILVRSVPGVIKCSLVESEDDKNPHRIHVEGMNIQELWKHSKILDIDKLRVNDVWAMLNTYGVEAARATAIEQLRMVFGVYGITVDHRHLSLITDYMTFDGAFRGMNRMSLRSNPSPFLKMSFESTVDFLRSTALYGDHDELRSNSAKLVVGNLTANGTGGCDLLQPLVVEKHV